MLINTLYTENLFNRQTILANFAHFSSGLRAQLVSRLSKLLKTEETSEDKKGDDVMELEDDEQEAEKKPETPEEEKIEIKDEEEVKKPEAKTEKVEKKEEKVEEKKTEKEIEEEKRKV